MAMPATRQELIDHCLRRLGSPVLEVNVDDDQIEDKVDDAIQLYQEYHSDATFRTYLKHQITAADVTNEYIDVPDTVLYVTKVYPFSKTFGSVNMFDIKYQMMLNSMGDFMNFAGGMSYYYQMEQYLEFLSDILDGEPRVTHSRHQGRIYIFGEWAPNQYNNLAEGDYIMFEVLSLVDPSTFADVWNDKFLKDYTTQLIKQQWGMNMSKFEGMQLPGGVTLSGAQYYQDATAELERLEEKMRNENEFPPDFFMG
jgi:hypothetical protein|tara:strand:+ start:459 stop:1220 length:762 start_codon:yes stop_codon:yes gene_type:complete